MHKLLLIMSAAVMVSCTAASLSSPDGRIDVFFDLNEDGQPLYSVSVDGETVIEPSVMGLEASELVLNKGFKNVGSVRKSADVEWTQPWGENKKIRDCHNMMAVSLKNDEGVMLTLEFKVFDDGLGYRYCYATPLDSLTITDENTHFNFASDGMSWSIASNFESYELPYREQNIASVQNANTPFTFKVGDVYGSIHEAALYDFPEMNLFKSEDGSLSFRSELAPRPDGCKARVCGKFSTPWRTIQLSDDAVGLINSSLILNLNEPCKIEDISWIKPQKYVGVWWGMHLGTQIWKPGIRHGATTANAIRHIDFAAANNVEGVYHIQDF